jgi:hypothetical protein
MSARQVSTTATHGGWAMTPHARKVLRYALGVTVCVSLSMALNWPLSFLTVLLAPGLLVAPAPLGFKAGLNMIATIILACLIALGLAHYMVPFPMFYVPFMGLVLFRLYFAISGGSSPLLITWLLITFMALPLLGLLHNAVPIAAAGGMVASGCVVVGVVWLSWALIPDSLGGLEPKGAGHGHAPPAVTRSERIRAAALSTAAVLPVVVLFYTLQWTGGLLIIIFIAVLSAQPDIAGSSKVGVAILIGNIFGCLVAIICFELLVMVPGFPFMMLLILFMGLVFGHQLLLGKKTSPLYGMAFKTALVVIISTASGAGDTDEKAPMRVLQILTVVTYLFVAFGILDKFVPGRKDSK